MFLTSNIEQLLKDLGLLAHKFGDLASCNKEIAKYGPETFSGDRIRLAPNKSGVVSTRNHIEIASFAGE